MKVQARSSHKAIAVAAVLAAVGVLSLGTAAALTPAGSGTANARQPIPSGRTTAHAQRANNVATTSHARPSSRRNSHPATAISINAQPRRRVEQVNEVDFRRRVLQSGLPVLVDFYADWCHPCRMLAPVLEQVARETSTAKVVKVNVDRNPRLAAKYGIRSLPSLMV